MNALLLIAHGSRRQASNDEVRKLTQDLARKAKFEYDLVECAFLELADPSILEGVTSCVRQGAKSVTVLPYFLSAGRHIATDIPAEIEKAQKIHSQLQIKIAPYLGSANEIGNVLMSLSKQVV